MPNPTGEDQTKTPTDKPVEKRAVIVNGVPKEVPVDDLVAAYQKTAGSDQKFQEAAALRREAETAIQFQKDFEAMQKNDEGAFRRVAEKMGWDQERIESTLAARRAAEIRAAVGGDEGDDDDEEPAASGKGVDVRKIATEVAQLLAKSGMLPNTKQPVGFTNLDPRLQRALAAVVDQNVKQNLQSRVDSDEYLGKLMKDGSDEQRSTVTEWVREEARRRATDGRDIADPREITEMLTTVKSKLQALGVSPAKARVPSPGLGSSGGSFGTLHQSGKPIPRPEKGSDDPTYVDYLVQTLNAALLEDESA